MQFARVFALGLVAAFIGAGYWWLTCFAGVVQTVVRVGLAVSGLFGAVARCFWLVWLSIGWLGFLVCGFFLLGVVMA